MKRNFIKMITVIFAAFIILKSNSIVYASNDDAAANEITVEETTIEETTAEEEEETISDGKLILTMFFGMLVMASLVVGFAAISTRGYRLNEKNNNKDVF